MAPPRSQSSASTMGSWVSWWLDMHAGDSFEDAPSVLSSDGAGGFSFFVAACFTVNYVVGTGFLALPWAFNEAGLVLSALVLVAFGIAADVSKNMMLEAIAVVDALERQDLSRRSLTPRRSLARALKPDSPDAKDLFAAESPDRVLWRDGVAEQTALLRRSEDAGRRSSLARPSNLVVGDRRFEVTELCAALLGRRGKDFYAFTNGAYLYGALWAYGSVFANALAAHVKLSFISEQEGVSYLIYLAAYAACVVPLSCMELHEQVVTQVSLAALRGVLVVAMVGTVINATVADDDESFDGTDGVQGAPLFRPEHLFKMAPIAAYANIFHHSIPNLAHTMKDRTQLVPMFASVFVFCNVAYGVIGVLVANYFGDDTLASANINWVDYSAGSAAWTDVVSYFVVIFPAMDVLSVFPLCAITLGNNLCAACHGDRAQEVLEGPRKLSWRLAAALPPLVGACFVSDLGIITDFSGTLGFLIGFFFPALLYLAAMRRASSELNVSKLATGSGRLSHEGQQGSERESLLWAPVVYAVEVVLNGREWPKTAHSTRMANPLSALVMIAFGVLGLASVFMCLVLDTAGAL